MERVSIRVVTNWKPYGVEASRFFIMENEKSPSNRYEFLRLLAKLNRCEIKQTEEDWSDNIPVSLYEKYFITCDVKGCKLHFKVHKDYFTSVDVVRINGYLLGVESITELRDKKYSTISNISDCEYTLKFYEMKESTSINYIFSDCLNS